MRMVVVLPAPLGPTKPDTAPDGTRRSILSTATRGPNFFVSPSVAIARHRARRSLSGWSRHNLRARRGSCPCRHPEQADLEMFFVSTGRKSPARTTVRIGAIDHLGWRTPTGPWRCGPFPQPFPFKPSGAVGRLRWGHGAGRGNPGGTEDHEGRHRRAPGEAQGPGRDPAGPGRVRRVAEALPGAEPTAAHDDQPRCGNQTPR